MKPHHLLLPLLACLLVAEGCAASGPSSVKASPDANLAAAAECVGTVAEAPLGARAVEDADLLRKALGPAGEGRLCTGRVLEATQQIKVYRVWQQDKAYTEIGSWWSLSRPAGPREAYRQQNAVCVEWSALDALSACEIKVGARFVMGPGQSARCSGGAEYGRSAVNQIFIPNDTRSQRVFVEGCERLGAWP